MLEHACSREKQWQIHNAEKQEGNLRGAVVGVRVKDRYHSVPSPSRKLWDARECDS